MNTICHFKEFVNEITLSASRKYKQEILTKYKDDKVVKYYLNIAYNPYLVFGISTKKLSKKVELDGALVINIFDLFDYLKSHNTGTDRDIKTCQAVLAALDSHDSEAAKLLESLICKDLSIGCDAKTINSVMPDLIPCFSPSFLVIFIVSLY